MDLTPYLMSWGILVFLLIVVAIYRQSLTSREDDSVHLHEGEEKAIDKQAALAKKISRVGTCVKILLGIVAVAGLAILALFLHYRFLGTESRAI